jgi:ATP-dependent DNA helicase PIF1
MALQQVLIKIKIPNASIITMLNDSLSSSQKTVVEQFLSGNNLFVSGGAGSGKSYLLNFLKKNYSHLGLEITASTGIAAINIGATTIHSWSGIGLANQPLEYILENLNSFKFLQIKKRIRYANCLAIDEISMISADVLDLLNAVLQHIRNNTKPMGGLQVLFFGDFLQLPPVDNNFKNDQDLKYCFHSQTWQQLNLQSIILDQVFRQSDLDFIKILNKIRFGNIDCEVKQVLGDRLLANDPSPSVMPTILTSHNHKVESINKNFLHQLSGQQQIFTAKYSGNENKITFLKKNCLAYDNLILKTGAQVMMIKNSLQKEGIINGSIGIVKDFSNKKNYPIVEFSNGKTFTIQPDCWNIEKYNITKKIIEIEASLIQVPLVLAWAITIHKSQGLTLDKIRCDLSQIFTPGQAYVALSRARFLDGVFIDSIDFNKINANQQAIDFYQNVQQYV